jgi:hypothetical protein
MLATNLPGTYFGVVFGPIMGALVYFTYLLTSPRRICPDCGTRLPRFKWEKWWYFLIDRKTCSTCGCIVNYEGRKLQSRRPRHLT